MDLTLGLEPFPEVPAVLATLREAGFRTAILSNGSPMMLEALVKRSGLEAMFDAVLSADAVRAFKTHPDVYQYALRSLDLEASAIAFQSSNAWDAHGASDFGMRVVWCNRYGQRRERLPGAPTSRSGPWPNCRRCWAADRPERADWSSAVMQPMREFPASKSKEIRKSRKKACISLHSFGRIGPFQGVTANPSKKIL